MIVPTCTPISNWITGQLVVNIIYVKKSYTTNYATSGSSRGTFREVLRYNKCCAPNPKPTNKSTDIKNRYIAMASNLNYYSNIEDTACGHQCEAAAKTLVEVVKQHDPEETTALDCFRIEIS